MRCALGGILLLLSAGCAAISSPQGGPRDRTPPRLIATEPDSAARNVRLQYIKLSFSEPIDVKELSKNLLITPQLDPDNSYSPRQDRTSLTLLFKKPLRANTTYSFNFRKAIVDATEGQPAPYQALTFSTGARLDSGRVQGTVTDLLTGRPGADVVVGLYRAADTVTVRAGRPYYLARTDAKGEFSLNFVQATSYRIYAWSDKNNNARFDDGEKIAYLPTPLLVSDTTRPQTLQLTRPDRLPPRRTGLEATPPLVRLRYNEGLASATLAPLTSPAPDEATRQAVQAAAQLSEGGRTLLVYKTPAVGDGRYLLLATDSTGNRARDTLNLRFPVPNAAGKKPAAVAGTTLEGNPRAVYRQGQLRFRFPVPVALVAGRPPGTLVEDSARRRPLRVPQDTRLSPDRTELTVVLDTKAQKRVEVQLDSTAILAVNGQSLGLRRPVRLTVSEQDPAGLVFGAVATKYKSYFVQLLDEKFNLVAELSSPRPGYRFERLAPSKYRLRVLIDADGDGRWRGGDPALKLPAEPVFLDPKVLDVRAGFEMEERLTF